MKAVLQRVSEAWVEVEGERIAEIGKGLLILLGIAENDDEDHAEYVAKKTLELRIFEDRPEKSISDLQLPVLAVSQFTLLAQTSKGRRPSFSKAAAPARANELFEYYVNLIKAQKIQVETGRFGAIMQVGLVNDGPFTIILDSEGK